MEMSLFDGRAISWQLFKHYFIYPGALEKQDFSVDFRNLSRSLILFHLVVHFVGENLLIEQVTEDPDETGVFPSDDCDQEIVLQVKIEYANFLQLADGQKRAIQGVEYFQLAAGRQEEPDHLPWVDDHLDDGVSKEEEGLSVVTRIQVLEVVEKKFVELLLVLQRHQENQLLRTLHLHQRRHLLVGELQSQVRDANQLLILLQEVDLEGSLVQNQEKVILNLETAEIPHFQQSLGEELHQRYVVQEEDCPFLRDFNQEPRLGVQESPSEALSVELPFGFHSGEFDQVVCPND